MPRCPSGAAALAVAVAALLRPADARGARGRRLGLYADFQTGELVSGSDPPGATREAVVGGTILVEGAFTQQEAEVVAGHLKEMTKEMSGLPHVQAELVVSPVEEKLWYTFILLPENGAAGILEKTLQGWTASDMWEDLSARRSRDVALRGVTLSGVDLAEVYQTQIVALTPRLTDSQTSTTAHTTTAHTDTTYTTRSSTTTPTTMTAETTTTTTSKIATTVRASAVEGGALESAPSQGGGGAGAGGGSAVAGASPLTPTRAAGSTTTTSWATYTQSSDTREPGTPRQGGERGAPAAASAGGPKDFVVETVACVVALLLVLALCLGALLVLRSRAPVHPAEAAAGGQKLNVIRSSLPRADSGLSSKSGELSWSFNSFQLGLSSIHRLWDSRQARPVRPADGTTSIDSTWVAPAATAPADLRGAAGQPVTAVATAPADLRRTSPAGLRSVASQPAPQPRAAFEPSEQPELLEEFLVEVGHGRGGSVGPASTPHQHCPTDSGAASPRVPLRGDGGAAGWQEELTIVDTA